MKKIGLVLIFTSILIIIGVLAYVYFTDKIIYALPFNNLKDSQNRVTPEAPSKNAEDSSYLKNVDMAKEPRDIASSESFESTLSNEPSTGNTASEYGGRGAFLTDNSPSTGDKHICENIDYSECTSVLESVCGWFDPSIVSCTEGPCVIRYVNECIACKDKRVVYWTEGECPFHG